MNKREKSKQARQAGLKSWENRQKDPKIKEKQRLAGIKGAKKRWG